MKLDGQVAVVTGGASGLGAATVRELVGGGARAVILDMDEEKGEALAEELGEAVAFHKTDVADPELVQGAVDKATAMGPLRVAVSCAGVGWAARTVGKDGSPHDLELYQKVVQVNLVGTFNVLRIAAAAMTRQDPVGDDGERGVVINTASIAAFEGQIGQVAYASSKAGVVGMTLPAARDLSKAGVRVMTIAPGTFDTPMLGQLPDDIRDKLRAGIPFPSRLGAPEDYGRLARHIVENDYLNGEVIRLDGALRMQPK